MSNNLRLICGDANQVLDRLIAENVKVDMIYTSPNPPFYVKGNPDRDETTTENNIGNEDNFMQYLVNLMNTFDKARAILKDDGSLWVHAGDYHNTKGSMSQIPQRLSLIMTDKYKWLLRSKLVWYRPDPRGPQEDMTRFKRDYEYLFWFTKTKDAQVYSTQYLYSSVIEAEYIMPLKGTWESGFPEKIIGIPIQTCTTDGMTIMDPYMGTGTTGVVALKMKRKFIGIELFPYKFNRTQERLRHET